MFPDISEYQGRVDWGALESAYRSGSIEAVAMRASFGTARADYQFARNQTECRSRGIPAIFYHFCYPAVNQPQDEAQFFNQVVGPLRPFEAMVGDFEDDSPYLFTRGDAGAEWARSFLSDLQSPQDATWWYTYPYLLSVVSFAQFYGLWPFWLADYSANPDAAFSEASFRQFTNQGQTPGVGLSDQSRVLRQPLSTWLTRPAMPAFLQGPTIPWHDYDPWLNQTLGPVAPANLLLT